MVLGVVGSSPIFHPEGLLRGRPFLLPNGFRNIRSQQAYQPIRSTSHRPISPFSTQSSRPAGHRLPRSPRPFLLNFFLTQYLFPRARQSVLRIPHFVFPSSIALHSGLLNQPHTLTFSVTRSSGPRPPPLYYDSCIAIPFPTDTPENRSATADGSCPPRRPLPCFPIPRLTPAAGEGTVPQRQATKKCGRPSGLPQKLRIYSTTNCIPAIWTPHKSHEGHSPYEAPASRR